MTLKDAIAETRQGYRAIGHSIGMSAAALCRLAAYGEYPTRLNQDQVKRKLSSALSQHGVSPADIEWPRPGIRPNYGLAVRRELSAGVPLERYAETREITQEDIDLMQIDRSVLARFGLRKNPFENDVEADEDVYQSKGYQQVAQAIRDAIDERGFLAVMAPSGAGKTTIWEGIESEYGQRDDMVICKLFLKNREKLSPDHLVRALLYGLAGDNAAIPRDAEDRGRMLAVALRDIYGRRKAVLCIDDAHFSSASALRQLKRFYEEKVGRFRLLSIILIGLSRELRVKLSRLPEIGNRIRVVEVPRVPVLEYLDFKLRRVGSSLEKIFTKDGLAAFLDRFREPHRPALGYPLIINVTCVHAMVKLHESGAEPGERINCEIIDALPGAEAVRRAAEKGA
ncbi:MAG: AAA family ATPase [Bryobacteraceae bacterium]